MMSDDSFPEDRAWSFVFGAAPSHPAGVDEEEPSAAPSSAPEPAPPIEPTITSSPAADAVEEEPPQTGTDRVLRVNALEAAVGSSREVTIGAGDAIRRVRIKVPPGTKPGTVLRIRHAETVYKFNVEITAHPWADVRDANICLRVPVTLGEAVEGSLIEIPTLNGPRSIRLPQGWTPAHSIIIKGAGLPDDKGGIGDMHVLPVVIPPDAEGEAVAVAARALNEHYRADVRAKMPKSLI